LAHLIEVRLQRFVLRTLFRKLSLGLCALVIDLLRFVERAGSRSVAGEHPVAR